MIRIFATLLLGWVAFMPPAFADPVFRYHLFKEPESLAPFEQKNSNAGYVLSQILSPLLRWQGGKFSSGLAKQCLFKSDLIVVCDLQTNLMFSDGSKLTSADFHAHFLKILNPANHARSASDLFDVRGAEELFLAKTNGPPLGIETKQNQIIFTLRKPQREFLHRLTSPLFSPYKGETPRKGNEKRFIGTGPYKLTSWKPGDKIHLEPNRFSQEGHANRPRLEVLFISEDSVALKLFESGELQFLRRLPTAFIPSYRNQPEYHEIEQIRFDYFGFSKKFREDPKNKEQNRNLSEAIALSIPYAEMQTLFQAKPRPGCFGLPTAWTAGQICFDQNIVRAKELVKKSSKAALALSFSQSVEDHRRALEWLQLKLAATSGIQLRLDGAETKVFLERLEKRQSPFFRRGLAPDRPTCAAVLENFLPGAPENYLDFDNADFQKLVRALIETSDEKQKTELCREAVLILKDSFAMIPTGPIFFSVLAKKSFVDWHLNELNQLDLKDLHPSK